MHCMRAPLFLWPVIREKTRFFRTFSTKRRFDATSRFAFFNDKTL